MLQTLKDSPLNGVLKFFSQHAQRERGKVIDVGVNIYKYFSD